MIVGNKLGIGGDHHIVIDCNSSCCHEEGVVHNHHILANLHAIAPNDIHKRHNPTIFTDIT